MHKLERAARLQSMLTQITGDKKLESVPAPSVGPAGLESLESMDLSPHAVSRDTIESGLNKLATDRHEQITDGELFGLEAIVMRDNRPVTFVRNDSYDDLIPPWTKLNDPETRKRIDKSLPMIGRIELRPPTALPYAGTGFVVGPRLLATNRHVARLFAEGLGNAIRYSSGEAGVNFRREVESPDAGFEANLSVKGVRMIHPYWDMALLEVDGLPDPKGLELSIETPESLETAAADVVVVGYPAPDFRNDMDLQNKIFGGRYYVKRLQPGVIRQRAKVQSFETLVNAMTHDASTLGGNSGSAIIDIKTGNVVGLHFGGEYLKANYAVPTYELARDDRLAKLLNFSGSTPSTRDFDAAWARVSEEKLAPRPPDPSPPEVQRFAASPPPTPVAPAGLHDAIWTIPLQIRISVGGPQFGAEPGHERRPIAFAPEPETGAEEEAVVVDQDYTDRKGYQPDFLESIVVPLPRLGDAMRADTSEVRADSRRNGDPYELAYHNYSVYMNKRRRTAWFSAANVDGDNRPAIGKRQGDRWYVDPRIPRAQQLGQDAFETGIDRGHLTRREDTAWGEDVDSATRSNNDTFHFTNCSLQASPFNRGKDRWQGLEQFLLEQHAKKERRRMIVVTGPIFAANDPVYRNDRMDYSVRCPLQFWKVCVLVRQDSSPSATAFVLGQEDIQNLPGFEEAFDVAATQVTIADLERRTGLSFGQLDRFDNFARSGQPTLELPAEVGRAAVKVIRSGRDVVV